MEAKVTNPVSSTIYATGISENSLRKLRNHGISKSKPKGPKRKPVVDPVLEDSFLTAAIRAIVQRFFANKKWPTVSMIYAAVRTELDFAGSEKSLRRIIKAMGYVFGKRPDAQVKERVDIVRKRHTYLREIKKHRLTGREIIYLDETWLNANHTVSRCWYEKENPSTGKLQVPSGKGSRLIILHAGSANIGFIPNCLLSFVSKSTADYHEEMNGDTFLKWFKEQLLPNIPPRSVIVMDNASYHSVISDKAPTLSNGGKKQDMRNWLSRHDIDFENTMIRVELDKLIQENKSRFPEYVIDNLAAENGHTVVRLPPYHCEFNPEELIWAQVKGNVARRNSAFNITTVKTLLEEEIAAVTPSNWYKASKHVEELEKEIFEKEIYIDNLLSEEELETFRFCPWESDSESESDSDSDYNNTEVDDGAGDSLVWFPDPAIEYDTDMDDSIDDGVEPPEFPNFTTFTEQ